MLDGPSGASWCLQRLKNFLHDPADSQQATTGSRTDPKSDRLLTSQTSTVKLHRCHDSVLWIWVKHGSEDICLLCSNDLRFLSQFQHGCYICDRITRLCRRNRRNEGRRTLCDA